MPLTVKNTLSDEKESILEGTDKRGSVHGGQVDQSPIYLQLFRV